MQHPESHLIANEVDRLGRVGNTQALAQLSDRIARTFLLQPPGGDNLEFRRALDFNAHLLTACRRRGVIWHRSD